MSNQLSRKKTKKRNKLVEKADNPITCTNTSDHILKSLEKIDKKLNKLISLYEESLVLYDNPYEIKTREERGLCDIVNAPNFEMRFKKLIENLPQSSIITITDIIRRLQFIKNKTGKMDIYTPKEKLEFQELKHFWASIFKISNGLYCYQNYFLPINHFEPSVFLYKHGLDQLKSVKSFKDKAILDVGAFVGDSAIILSPLTKKKVYCFESVSENYDFLLKTIELNNLKNIVPMKVALGSNTQNIDMRVDSYQSSLKKELVKKPKYVEKCQMIKLDDYVQKNKLKVGLIKVDIEGNEMDFLKGAIQTIKEQIPTLLISIYHTVDDFLDIKPMIEDLSLGYKFKVFRPTLGNISGETILICEK